MLYKNPRLSQRDFRGSTAKGKQDSSGIGDLYPLQIITADRAVDKREQLVTPGAQDTLYVFKPGGVTSGSEVEARTASRSSTALLTGR